MVLTNDESFAERLRQIRNHGQKQTYCHTSLGYNLRMSDLHAAIGVVQTRKLEDLIQRRIRNAMFFMDSLQGVSLPQVHEGTRHVFQQFTIRVPSDRDAFVERLTT